MNSQENNVPLQSNKVGRVFLVGAGPGDPGLITLRGKNLLERAEVVIYDYLAGKKILQYAAKNAELIYVGKMGGGAHAHTQGEINAMLVARALAGKRVVRLKGGDPFIFGRGGEEIQELVQAGVPFEVVPGVTSASAAATYAGIPITHRQHTASVAFVTGHEDPTKTDSSIAWDKLATAAGTLVFYMGIKNIATISRRLIENGRDPQTPVAVVRWASTPDQRTVVGNLATIAEVVKEAGIKPPAITIVGEVVNLREELNWYEHRPLFGKRIMVTRTREQASDLVAQLEDLGADCVEFATIDLQPPPSWEPLDQALAELGSYQWLLFTSINAIHYFFERLFARGLDARNLGGLKIGAVGSSTNEVLRKFGLHADLLPTEFTGEGLAEVLVQHGVAGSRILLPRALKASEVLPSQLRAAGATVDVAPVYQNVRPAGREQELHDLFAAKAVDMVTFSSSSTFTNFQHMLNIVEPGRLRELLAGVKIAAIGPVTAAAVRKSGLSVDVQPESFTITDLVESIGEFFARQK